MPQAGGSLRVLDGPIAAALASTGYRGQAADVRVTTAGSSVSGDGAASRAACRCLGRQRASWPAGRTRLPAPCRHLAVSNALCQSRAVVVVLPVAPHSGLHGSDTARQRDEPHFQGLGFASSAVAGCRTKASKADSSMSSDVHVVTYEALDQWRTRSLH